MKPDMTSETQFLGIKSLLPHPYPLLGRTKARKEMGLAYDQLERGSHVALLFPLLTFRRCQISLLRAFFLVALSPSFSILSPEPGFTSPHWWGRGKCHRPSGLKQISNLTVLKSVSLKSRYWRDHPPSSQGILSCVCLCLSLLFLQRCQSRRIKGPPYSRMISS